MAAALTPILNPAAWWYALPARVRSGTLSPQDRDRILTAVDVDVNANNVRIIPLSPPQGDLALLLLRQYADHYGLRTLDALQLSAALLAKPDEYVVSDRRLLSLARHLGLTTTGIP